MSGTKGDRVKMGRKEVLHACVSATWRITVQTLLEEYVPTKDKNIFSRPNSPNNAYLLLHRRETIKYIMKPYFLLAAIRIDSSYNPKLIQKLRVFAEIPRITLHLVNHLTYGGKSKRNGYRCCVGLTPF